MQEYYFLFGLALLWTFFATIQDLKSREVANWLNFSLIAFALAYRAFYAIFTSNLQFFLLGLFGFFIFFALAYALYYSRAFAGGDAKLLMGFGIILPFSDYWSLISLSLLFLFTLFLIGAIYSIIYSFIIVSKNSAKFTNEFRKRFNKNKSLMIASLLLFIALTIFGFVNQLFFLIALIALLPFIWLYTKSLDRCMLVLTNPKELTEGDWLERSIKIGNKTIKKTVHGLSLEEIKLLKKHKKKVLIKQGIPFVPAFLITLILMVSFFLTSGLSLDSLVSSLF